MDTTRISRTIKGFNNDLVDTNDYLTQECAPPPVGNTNGQRLGWTVAELAQWVLFLSMWAPLYILYSNKKGTRTSLITAKLKKIIKDCVAYERSHHLYDRMAVNSNATTDDFTVFRIVRSTELEETTRTKPKDVGVKTVIIAVTLIKHLLHKLLVKAPNIDGRGKEEGVKNILVYVAYTEIKDEAPLLETFNYYGDVSRGYITIIHDEDKIGKKAWYIARVKNSVGQIGIASEAVSEIVI